MKESQRILVISDRYLPEIGGSITWLHNVYSRAQPGTVWILTQDYPDAAKFDRAHPDLSIVRRTLKRYPFLKPESLLIFLKLFLSALWIVLRHRIDVIHAGKNIPEGYVARLVKRFLGTPYIIYAHGEEITVCAKDPRLQPAIRPVYDDAAAVIANSRFTVEVAKEAGIRRDHVAQISPGTDPDFFRPGRRDLALVEKHHLEDRLVLLTVGRMQRRKGHDYVIQSLPEIRKRLPSVTYLIASDGHEWNYLHELAREREVEDIVKFLGPVEQEDLVKLYNTCDIFIMANRTMPDGDVEGFGIVFLEAGACEKPVIGGMSGGTADSIRHERNGLRIDASRHQEIIDAVIRLGKDSGRRREMGRAGREVVLESYAWDTIAERILSLSRDVLEGKGVATEAPAPREKVGEPR